MANLVVTADCNQNCAYCFAEEYLKSDKAHDRFLTLERFADRVAFLDISGIEQIRLIGGEPSLHPLFGDLMGIVEDTGKDILVFTNGLMGDEAIQRLLMLPQERLTVLVNVNEPDTVPAAAHKWRSQTLSALGARALVGFTVYRPDFDASFLLQVIAETGCRPVVRIGMAQPCLSGHNRAIHPLQYQFIGHKIAFFARMAQEASVGLSLDCGFVPCMFSEEDLHLLHSVCPDIGWHCNPVLDITIDGRVLPCFPLAGRFSIDLGTGMTAQDMRRILEAQLSPYRQAGVFPVCSTCSTKLSGECPGGCLAATVRRFHHSSNLSLSRKQE